MKADIPRPLRIPAWVPKEVARSARDGLDRRFWPLVRDSRMRNVWTVLSQRRNGSFMYPVRDGGGGNCGRTTRQGDGRPV